MILMEGAGGLVMLGIWVFALIDVIQTPDHEVRTFSKGRWVLIVLFGSAIGGLAWLVAGRPESYRRGTGYAGTVGRNRRTEDYPEYDRAGRYAAGRQGDDDEFLAQVRDRAAQQRERERQQRQAARDEIRGHTDKKNWYPPL